MEAMGLAGIEDVESCLGCVQLIAAEVQKHQNAARDAKKK
jgi:hypothetical protein